MAGATFGNIIAGGGIGIFVDAATGAAQRYPDKAIVWLEPESFASPEIEAEWMAEKQKFDEEQKAREEAKKAQTKPRQRR